MAQAIGMMDSAYFVGRKELVDWINATLQMGIVKVEQTASGAAACQLLDMLHPGAVAFSKVDCNAKGEYEYISNYKVLQAAFNKLEIDKFVDVNKLVKARPLDNMEFMQWFKCYFDQLSRGRDFSTYDPILRRQQSKTGDYKTPGMSLGGSSAAPSRPAPRPAAPRVTRPAPKAAPAPSSRPASAANQNQPHQPPVRRPAAPKLSCTTSDAVAHIADLEKQLEAAKVTQEEAAAQLDNAERERDFYFDKLRDIEILCQLPELAHVQVLRSVEKILYATDPAEAKDVIVQLQVQVQNSVVEQPAAAHDE